MLNKLPNPPTRAFFTKQRRKLSPQQRIFYAKQAGQRLHRLHNFLPKNANIALYLNDFGELPTFPIVQFCQKYGHTPHLPIVIKNTLQFSPIRPTICQNAFANLPAKRHPLGMLEPLHRQKLLVHKMDLIVCPLVAIDKHGTRMGMGGGFYDRTLQHFNGIKMGWCYDFQFTDSIPKNAWDIGMDMVITDKRMVIF